MSRQREAADLGQRVALEAQDVNIAVDEIADIEKVPIGAEGDAFCETADFGLGAPCAPSCRRFSAVPRSYPGRPGTVFHRTRTDLSKWFLAAYLMGHDKRGVSAKFLQRELAVAYQTAWTIAHKLRHGLSRIRPVRCGAF